MLVKIKRKTILKTNIIRMQKERSSVFYYKFITKVTFCFWIEKFPRLRVLQI